MTNRKSKTIRKIRPATSQIPTPPAPGRTCSPIAESGTSQYPPRLSAIASEKESRNTEHATRVEPSGTQPPAPDHQPTTSRASKPKSRNGKVARLAKPLRDMINLMLQNNISHQNIVEALQERDVRVNQRNISNWKTRGGYNEWRLEQERILTKRLRQDNITDYLRALDATHLPEVGLQLAATQLCEFLLNSQTEQQLTSDPEKYARTLSNLCRVTRHIHLLQKYRDDSARELGYNHNPERIKRETDNQLEIIRDVYSAEKLGESINEPDISHRNFIPKNMYLYPTQNQFEQNSARSRIDPLSILSDVASSLKNAAPSKPESPSTSNSAS